MSIAYGLDQPVVDGNVRRVFARILDVAEPSESLLWMEAGQLVTGGRPGDLNQALMELGATLCTPRSPQCEKCPIAEFCTAHRNGTQAERPLKRRPRRVPQERHGVAVVAWEENLLLVRRPADGRLGGMWEFPGVLRHPGETIAAAAGRAAQEWAGLSVAVEGPLGVVEHAFTHVRVRYEAMWAAVDPDRGPPPTSSHDQGIAWVSRSGLDAYALPRAQRRIAALIEAGS